MSRRWQLPLESAMLEGVQPAMHCCMRAALSQRSKRFLHACWLLALPWQTMPPHEAARLARIQARAGEVQVPSVFGYK